MLTDLILRWFNPCLHEYDIVATLKDDEDRPQAVKIVQSCKHCGNLRETTLKAPGWCDHRWQTLQTIRVFHEKDEGKEGAFPIGFAKIVRCERCGDVKRVNLYEQPDRKPSDALPQPAARKHG